VSVSGEGTFENTNYYRRTKALHSILNPKDFPAVAAGSGPKCIPIG
jgi:hypothetical protein